MVQAPNSREIPVVLGTRLEGRLAGEMNATYYGNSALLLSQRACLFPSWGFSESRRPIEASSRGYGALFEVGRILIGGIIISLDSTVNILYVRTCAHTY